MLEMWKIFYLIYSIFPMEYFDGNHHSRCDMLINENIFDKNASKKVRNVNVIMKKIKNVRTLSEIKM